MTRSFRAGSTTLTAEPMCFRPGVRVRSMVRSPFWMRTASPGASGTVQQSLDALARQAHGAPARSVLVCSQRRRVKWFIGVHSEYQILISDLPVPVFAHKELLVAESDQRVDAAGTA